MKSLDLTQTEQLRQIADYLCHQRQEKNIPLEKVAKDTFIPLRLLQAMESSQFDRLPEPVYIKGFIRRYAEVLGLNGTEVASRFQVEPAGLAQPAELRPELKRPEPQYLKPTVQENPRPQPQYPEPQRPTGLKRSEPQSPEPQRSESQRPEFQRPSELKRPELSSIEPLRPLDPEPDPEPRPFAPASLQTNGRSLQPPQSPQPSVAPGIERPSRYEPAATPSQRSGVPSYLPWIGAGLALGTIAAIAVAVIKPPIFNSGPNPATGSDPTALNSASGTGVESSPPTSEASPASPDSAVSPSPTADAPVQVTVNLTDESWMEVIADGKREYEGTLPKGEQRTWKAKKSLVVSAGNAGAVLAAYNQGEAKPLGKLGDVVEVTFPKP
jgi:cytoskeletal protein RodZ